MHLNTLQSFRQEIYGCLTRAQDALFNLLDALVSEPAARSLPELSLSPCFEREWPSVYEALEDGRIDQQRLQEGLVTFLPKPEGRLWLAIDGSSIARPDAVTSDDSLDDLCPQPDSCQIAIALANPVIEHGSSVFPSPGELARKGSPTLSNCWSRWAGNSRRWWLCLLAKVAGVSRSRLRGCQARRPMMTA